MAKGTVRLLGDFVVYNEDDKAAEAITPGHLVTYNGSGDLIKQNVAGADCARTFAFEREEMGDGIDDAYAINDTVLVGYCTPGTRLYVPVPSGQTLTKGQYLESAGNGTLRAIASGTRLARSLDNTGALTTTTRVRVEVV